MALLARLIPARLQWLGYLAAVGAGTAIGLIQRPPREEWAHLHGFESGLWNNVLPPSIAMLAAFGVAYVLHRAGKPLLLLVVAGALAYFAIEIVVVILTLFACCA